MIETIPTVLAGIFAGAAIYIAFVEHPARIECGTVHAVAEFGASYRRGSVFMGTLLSTAFLTGIAAYVVSARVWWLVGACLLLALIPLTVIAILPINKKLLTDCPEADPTHVLGLLIRWGKWHRLRSLVGVTSFLMFLFLLFTRPG